ncbi:MAG: glycosyltransferase [Methylococcales bacterium]|nr:glycosyltransferase [Methylococcales bacterium]
MTVDTAIKVSVIVPVFNAGDYLRPAIASLLAQSESAIEVIAVNDGSTDDSLLVLNDMAEKDTRLIVLSKENGGLSSARNYGIKHARGRWLAFVDSDDWLMPDALNRWCQRAEENKLHLLIGNYFNFATLPCEQPVAKLTLQPWDQVMRGTDWIIRSVALREWPHYVWLQLISREFLLSLKTAEFREGLLHEDVLWTLQLALSAERVGFVRDALYGYRTNPVSITNNPLLSAQRARSYIYIIQQLGVVADKYRLQNPDVYHALLRHANVEGGHFLGLMRKKIADVTMRRELALSFLTLGLFRVMLHGATNRREYWGAFRVWFIMYKYSLFS